MRCVYVERKEIPLSDMKMHTIFICRNKQSERNKTYSIDKCTVCGNCLLHTNHLPDVTGGGDI